MSIDSIRNQEPIPSQEEIHSVFEQLIGAVQYRETRKLEDERGLYLWDIEIPGEKVSLNILIEGDDPQQENVPGYELTLLSMTPRADLYQDHQSLRKIRVRGS